MKQSKTPLWKKSILQHLNLYDILSYLEEIADNGDCYGYDGGQDGYYQEYKDLFDDLSAMAYRLMEVISDYYYTIGEHWDDMTVSALGETQTVLGFDTLEQDYFKMVIGEEWAVEEAQKRVLRMTKQEMLMSFRQVLGTLTAFLDIKTAHDCLTAVVDELDQKGAILEIKNQEINRLYEDITDSSSRELDEIIKSISPNSRIWVE